MATLDRLRKKDRQWHEYAEQCGKTILRAAAVQGRQHGMRDPISAANRLAESYNIRNKSKDWREYGDVAFHLAVTWPPDLAYIVIYAFREIQPPIGYDPVPLIMKALEMLRYLRHENMIIQIEMDERIRKIAENPNELAKASAKLLVRELSSVPLRWATGIYRALDSEVRNSVRQELLEFNPKSAKILLKGGFSWLLTGTGLLQILNSIWRAIHKILFGKE